MLFFWLGRLDQNILIVKSCYVCNNHSIGSRTLVNLEKGFLHLQYQFQYSFSYCIIVVFSYCIIVVFSYCIIVVFSYCIIVVLIIFN